MTLSEIDRYEFEVREAEKAHRASLAKLMCALEETLNAILVEEEVAKGVSPSESGECRETNPD